MKIVLRENTWLLRGFTNFGWGNGYVIIPIGHPFHGVHYGDIPVNVHGGLTFSEMVDRDLIESMMGLDESDLGAWCVGFDTAHFGDDLESWPKGRVYQETEELRGQLEALSVPDPAAEVRRIYIVTCDKLNEFQTFGSMNEVVSYLDRVNKESFDGRPFSLYGRDNQEYLTDSAVLSPQRSSQEYFTFFIRCIDGDGNRIELD